MIHRMAKKEKTEIGKDAIILESVKLDENDCFGHLYSAKEKECKVCADNKFCSIVFGEIVAKKIKEDEKNNGPYIDSFKELSNEQWEDIGNKIEDKLNKTKDAKISLEVVYNRLKELMCTKDSKIVEKRFAENVLKKRKIKIDKKNNVLYN